MGNRICCLGGNPPQAAASSDAGESSPEGGNVRHVRGSVNPPTTMGVMGRQHAQRN